MSTGKVKSLVLRQTSLRMMELGAGGGGGGYIAEEGKARLELVLRKCGCCSV